MDRRSRPIILARWIGEESVPRLETLTQRVALAEERVRAIRSVYERANGQKRIEELVDEHLSLEVLIRFFEELEASGICFDAHHTAMAGHRAGNNPDFLRECPEQSALNRLIQLPPDPPGRRVVLPEVEADSTDVKRRSVRSFSAEPLSLEDVSKILLSSYGRTQQVGPFVRRSVPSGGAMYPLENDILALNCAVLGRARYRFAKHENALICMGDYQSELFDRAFQLPHESKPAMVQVISFDIQRSAGKYGSRAYRLALLEAGHAAQNAIRKATELGIGCYEYGGYLDEELETLCGLRSPTSGIATTLLYGHPSA